MFGLFQRPKLDASFQATTAIADEFARSLALAGTLTVRNEGADAELGHIEMMVIAGYRRIPLEVPPHWQTPRLPRGGAHAARVEWALTLDAPLRADRGELAISAQDQKGKKWEWRLPFSFERR